MEQDSNGPKRIKSFWAIVVVLVVAVIAGGLIYWFQFNYSYDEEISAIQFRIQRRAPAHTSTTTEPAAKTTLPKTK